MDWLLNPQSYLYILYVSKTVSPIKRLIHALEGEYVVAEMVRYERTWVWSAILQYPLFYIFKYLVNRVPSAAQCVSIATCIPLLIHLYIHLESPLHGFFDACSWRYFSFSSSRQSWGCGSLPSVFLTPPAKADLPAYSWYPSPDSLASRLLKVMGWLPRNRLRISIMPRRHSPKPFFSCWHFVGNVSDRGGRRQSAAEWRSTITHSLSCRHCASAAPGSLTLY